MTISETQRQTLLNMVEDIAGPEVKKVAIVLLDSEEETTDEIIAEELDIKLNNVRKALYRLYDIQLASFRRIRDKNSGWFLYLWKIHPERIDDIISTRRKEVLNKIKMRLEFEESQMFFQSNCEHYTRISFQDAMVFEFVCPECGEKFEPFENEVIINALKLRKDELVNLIKAKNGA